MTDNEEESGAQVFLCEAPSKKFLRGKKIEQRAHELMRDWRIEWRKSMTLFEKIIYFFFGVLKQDLAYFLLKNMLWREEKLKRRKKKQKKTARRLVTLREFLDSELEEMMRAYNQIKADAEEEKAQWKMRVEGDLRAKRRAMNIREATLDLREWQAETRIEALKAAREQLKKKEDALGGRLKKDELDERIEEALLLYKEEWENKVKRELEDLQSFLPEETYLLVEARLRSSE